MRYIKKLDEKIFFYNRKIRKLLKLNINYHIDNFNILLTPDHSLPIYQKYFKNYDKFLPKLVRNLKKKSSFIDIGCNCGDTFFSVYNQNRTLKYYCIDAEKQFINLFKKNIANNKSKININNLIVSECLIGKNLQGQLIGDKGSKRLLVSKNSQSIKSQTLDSYASLNKIKNISLIKIDTDGYDYNIIYSSLDIIKRFKPIFFYECFISDEKSKKEYLNLLEFFRKKNYKYFTFFDNYGNLISKDFGYSNAKDLLRYLVQNTKQHDFASIVYYDILVYSDKDIKLINKSIKNH